MIEQILSTSCCHPLIEQMCRKGVIDKELKLKQDGVRAGFPSHTDNYRHETLVIVPDVYKAAKGKISRNECGERTVCNANNVTA